MCEDKEMEKYAQHMEIEVNDMDGVLRALMASGYQCLVSQDGETMSVVGIDYVHPEYEGRRFVETEW